MESPPLPTTKDPLIDALELTTASRIASAFVAESTLMVPNLPPLRVTKADVGDLELPLSPESLDKLRAVAEQAPFGHGDKTIVDRAVRDTLQLGPDDLALDTEWQSMATLAARNASQRLGMPGHELVEAQLHKLLLYNEGGHFKPHRDTEKTPGMFGTMVLQLPCTYTGGVLHVRQWQEKQFFFGQTNPLVADGFAPDDRPTVVHSVAFFADCEHWVDPVTSGTRLCLVYNLVQTGSPGDRATLPTIPTTPELEAAMAQLTTKLNALAQNKQPTVAFVMLEHQYTGKSESLKNLKGIDAATCQLLQQLCNKHGLMLEVGIFSKACTQLLDEGGDYMAGTDREITFHFEGIFFDFGLTEENSMMLDPERFASIKPEFESAGYMGNEAGFETDWYA